MKKENVTSRNSGYNSSKLSQINPTTARIVESGLNKDLTKDLENTNSVKQLFTKIINCDMKKSVLPIEK